MRKSGDVNENKSQFLLIFPIFLSIGFDKYENISRVFRDSFLMLKLLERNAGVNNNKEII